MVDGKENYKFGLGVNRSLTFLCLHLNQAPAAKPFNSHE